MNSDVKMIQITDKPISPENIINQVKTSSSGCVVVYVGLIRDNSRGKDVISVEYEDTSGRAAEGLREIAAEIKQKWPVNEVAICHRAGHREEGYAASQYAVDRFKEKLPTAKRETYIDGSVWTGE